MNNGYLMPCETNLGTFCGLCRLSCVCPPNTVLLSDVYHISCPLPSRPDTVSSSPLIRLQLKLLLGMLHLSPWCFFPLTLQYLSSTYAQEAACKRSQAKFPSLQRAFV